MGNEMRKVVNNELQHRRELRAKKTKIANFEMWQAARSEIGREPLRCALRAVLDANEDYSEVIWRDVPDEQAVDAAIEARHNAVDAARAALRTDPVVAALLEIIESRDFETAQSGGVECARRPDLFELLGEDRMYDLAYPQMTGNQMEP